MTPREFLDRTADVTFAERGMFFSEVYLFVNACEAAGVTQIIESGVCHGVSTRLLHALYPGRVVSIEADPSRLPAFFPYPLVIGDGMVLVPHFVRQYADRRVGLLLDGPKNRRAKLLRDQCLREAPHVRVIGIHDEPMGRGEVLHSLDPQFRSAVGATIDARVPQATRGKYEAGAPGLAIWRAA
jgi:hypothetical protein